jgi:hypothetical protein
MEVQHMASDWKTKAERLLLDRAAATIAHPGGTLFEHLRRVAQTLESWDASEALQAAGLCHACYGTDGFPISLLDLDERPLLAEAIGSEGEAIVYLYASCDRSAVYPRLGSPGQLQFTNRFTGRSSQLEEQSSRNFLELTAANELDLVLAHPESGLAWGPDFHRLLLRGRRWMSPQALDAWETAIADA